MTSLPWIRGILHRTRYSPGGLFGNCMTAWHVAKPRCNGNRHDTFKLHDATWSWPLEIKLAANVLKGLKPQRWTENLYLREEGFRYQVQTEYLMQRVKKFLWRDTKYFLTSHECGNLLIVCNIYTLRRYNINENDQE